MSDTPTDLDERMAAVEKRLDALEAAAPAPAGSADDDSSLEARVTKLEVEVFPPADAAPADATATA